MGVRGQYVAVRTVRPLASHEMIKREAGFGYEELPLSFHTPITAQTCVAYGSVLPEV